MYKKELLAIKNMGYKQKVPFNVDELLEETLDFNEYKYDKREFNRETATKMVNETNSNLENSVDVSEIDTTTLGKVFYSDDNIELINKELVLSVYKKTNGGIKINFQQKEDLLVVMRWVYINYARNLPFKIAEQIKKLNSMVVGEIMPGVISQANQHIDYLRDIEKPLEPLPRPVNASRDRSLPTAPRIIE